MNRSISKSYIQKFLILVGLGCLLGYCTNYLFYTVPGFLRVRYRGDLERRINALSDKYDRILAAAITADSRARSTSQPSQELVQARTRRKQNDLAMFVPELVDFLPHHPQASEVLRPAFCMCGGGAASTTTTVSITIGIPTVVREQRNYLMDTLDNLLSNMSPEEQADTLIVIFVGEASLEVVKRLAEQIRTRFADEVQAGLIELISPPAAFYPDLEAVPLSLGDPRDRVKWRSKQNLDFAFLMSYAKPRSKYYVQLEDDVIAKKDFVSTMKAYALQSDSSGPWMMLSFSDLGFIGKLFKTSDLPVFITLFVLFFETKPVDLLLHDIIGLRACGVGAVCDYLHVSKLAHRFSPSLFQHMGMLSSLPGKIQNLKDSSFGETPQFFPHDNPAASVQSAIEPFAIASNIQAAYTGKNFFWGKPANAGDLFNVTFSTPIKIKRYLIRSGNLDNPSRTLPNTTVVWIKPMSAVNDRIEIGNFDQFGVARGAFNTSMPPIARLGVEAKQSTGDFIVSEILIVPG